MKEKDNKIAFLFLVTRNIERKDYWNNFFNIQKKNIYIHNDKSNIESYQLPNEIILTKTKKTKWGYILEAIIELLEEAFKNIDNDFFIICSESCIPIKKFDVLYDFLYSKNKSMIEIWKMDKYSYSKIKNLHQNHIKHSAFWILKRDIVSKIIKQKKKLLKIYNFESGEEYFLSSFYNNYKKGFLIKQTTYTNWNYNNSEIKKLYLKKKTVKTDEEYFKIKNKISELSSHPKTYIDDIPNFLLSKNNKFFFARKFILSTKELYLKNYQFKNIYIISGLQRSGNHMFIRLLIESMKDKVLYINDLQKRFIKNLFNENIFDSFIFRKHYLSKNINNLLSVKDLLNKKKIENLIITTEEFSLLEIEELYDNFKNKKIYKLFIMRDLLNLTASRLEYMNKFNKEYDMFVDDLFIKIWLDYFYYSQDLKNKIIVLNYNLYILYKEKYIKNIFNNKLNITYNTNIKSKQKLFADGSSFHSKNKDYLERYKSYINHKVIKRLMNDDIIMKILKKYFLIFE